MASYSEILTAARWAALGVHTNTQAIRHAVEYTMHLYPEAYHLRGDLTDQLRRDLTDEVQD